MLKNQGEIQKQSSWQLVKHTKLYSDPSRFLKRLTDWLRVLNWGDINFYICNSPSCRPWQASTPTHQRPSTSGMFSWRIRKHQRSAEIDQSRAWLGRVWRQTCQTCSKIPNVAWTNGHRMDKEMGLWQHCNLRNNGEKEKQMPIGRFRWGC